MKPVCVLIGRGTIAVNCLRTLHKKGYDPVAVICDMNDYGKDTWTKSLYKYARSLRYKNGHNLFRERKVNDEKFVKLIRTKFPNIDTIFSVQPYAIFRKPFIKLAKKHVINLHFAPLPKLRGVAPCSWAFLDGLKQMGVSLHLIEDVGVDNGPVIAQKFFLIKRTDTAWSLFNKCITAGTSLFALHIDSLIKGSFRTKLQNNKIATYHSKHELDFANMEIDTSKKPKEVVSFVQARIFPPFQLPYVIFNKKRHYISAVKPSKKKGIWFRGKTMYYQHI